MSIPATSDVSAAGARILFGSQEGAVDLLAGPLTRDEIVGALAGVFSRLGAAGRKVVARRVAEVAARLVDVPFSPLLVAAWRKHQKLIEAARASFDAPESPQLVELVTHRISSIHKPSVELVVDDVSVGRIDFQLELSFLVRGMIATLKGGELAEIHSGECHVAAALAAEGIEVARGEGEFDLPVAVRLEEPVRLWPSEQVIVLDDHGVRQGTTSS